MGNLFHEQQLVSHIDTIMACALERTLKNPLENLSYSGYKHVFKLVERRVSEPDLD